jgi:CheY-like chemotaxis protein
VKILLIDDSRTMLHENQRVLERAGHLVVSAEDGESALRLASEAPFNLIILDLLLPGIGGLEVLKRLKSDPASAEIPVVIVSSLCEKNREKLIAAGAEDYFEKNALMPQQGKNLLPKAVERVMCRIHRKHGARSMVATANPEETRG